MSSMKFAAGGPLRGSLRVPGDKSISHRALLFGARAEGTSAVTGLSRGEDVLRTRAAMEAMGARVDVDGDGVAITGGLDNLHEADSVIDLGNSGTSTRLMAGWCATFPGLTVLTGDASLRARPMSRVVDPLREMGAKIDGRQSGSLLPLTFRGTQLRGIEYSVPMASAQVKSAILIAGLEADGETVIHERVATRPHTEELFALAGVDIDVEEHSDGGATVRLQPSLLKAFTLHVPGDPSQAAFWIVAALVVPDSDITIENVYVGPTRAGLIDVLTRMGADIDLAHRDANTADIRVRHSELSATDINGEEVPSMIDELPVLSVAAAVATGTTVVSDAAEMRVKESDRIAAVCREIGGLGAIIEERSDGFAIQGSGGRPLTGGRVNAALDHRIAMTGAVAALVSSKPTVVEGWESVATSYPSYTDDLARLRS